MLQIYSEQPLRAIMADRNAVGDSEHQQRGVRPQMQHHRLPQQTPPPHISSHPPQAAPRAHQQHPPPRTQYPIRPIYPRMPMNSGPVDPHMLQYYPPDRRLSLSQIPTGQMPPALRQNFGPLSNFVPNNSNPALYGQPAPQYMPQNLYVAPHLYTPRMQPPPIRQYPVIKRERKALQIVNPETNEVVTSSKTDITPASLRTVPKLSASKPVSLTTASTLPIPPMPSSVAVYQKQPSKALKIEAPPAIDEACTGFPSKPLKTEPPRPSPEEPKVSAIVVRRAHDSPAASQTSATGGIATTTTTGGQSHSRTNGIIHEKAIRAKAGAAAQKLPDIRHDEQSRDTHTELPHTSPLSAGNRNGTDFGAARNPESERRQNSTDPDLKLERAQLTGDSSINIEAKHTQKLVGQPQPAIGDDELSWRQVPGVSADTASDNSWRGSKGAPTSGVADNAELQRVADQVERTPLKRQRPKLIVHEAGARRVYGVSWLVEMKDFHLTTKAPVEAQRCGIAKKGHDTQQTTSIKIGLSQGGGRAGSSAGSTWVRGQGIHMGGVFGRGGGKGGSNQYPDRGPRRGSKLPPAPVPQPQSWRGSSRPNELSGINRPPALPPVEPLKKSENAWVRKKEDDDDVAAKTKLVRSILNKLTPEKFDRLYKQLVDVKISSVTVLDGIVKEIFEKAVLELKFADMYAQLCRRLDRESEKLLAATKLTGEGGRTITFKRMLLRNVQNEFRRFAESEKRNEESEKRGASSEKQGKTDAGKNEAAKSATGTEGKQGPKKYSEETHKAAAKAKRRMLGNINFIGELYKESLIADKIIHMQCVQPLLNKGIETKEDEFLEALCKLIATVGEKLSAKDGAKRYMDRYFEEMGKLSRDYTLPSRIRFMLQNLVEMRQNNWKRRREEQKAKKISEVHADIKREERQKQEASSRNRGRGGGSRYQSRYDRPVMRTPAPAMTMAPARSSNVPTVSRAVKARERYKVPPYIQSRTQPPSGDFRFAAGASQRPFGTAGRAPPVALKPGGSARFSSGNAFSALSTGEESATQSSGNGGLWQRETRIAALKSTELDNSKPEISNVDLEPRKIKEKSRSILQEYLSIKDLKEARECVEIEVPAVSRTKFLDAALRCALDFRPQDGDQVIDVFIEWTKVIPAAHYREALTNIISMLDDIEMDSPRAASFLAKCIGCLAALNKFTRMPREKSMGLDFLVDATSPIFDGKRAMKFIILTFSELSKALEPKVREQTERDCKVYEAYKRLDIDLKSLASKWNPARGLALLSDLLSEHGVKYLEPFLGMDEKVKSILNEGGSGEDVASFVKQGVPRGSLKSVELARLLLRQGLEYACHKTKSLRKESITRQDVEDETIRFRSKVVPMLTEIFGTAENENFADERFIMIVEAQQFCAENDFPPGILDSENVEQKLFPRILYSLYDKDVVEEEVLRRWKEDLNESKKASGKGEALVQSQRLFNWLENAEAEE